jgi:hypothetical protein
MINLCEEKASWWGSREVRGKDKLQLEKALFIGGVSGSLEFGLYNEIVREEIKLKVSNG